MRILITGGSSYFGQHLVPLVVSTSTHEILYTYYQNDPMKMDQGKRLNILDETAVQSLVLEFCPEIIIHTVGSNRGPDMDAVIRLGTKHITAAAASINARLIHLSTDVVFNGREAPYDELAKPNPVNEYGRAKAAAESIISEVSNNYVIVRTSLIYGLRKMDHGTRWMVNALKAGETVTLFDNQWRNPVWVETLCQACLEFATNDYIGIMNIAGQQKLSRAQFALKMLDWWGVIQRDTIIIGPSIGDRWPLDCQLDLSRATQLLSTPMKGVDEVLANGNE